MIGFGISESGNGLEGKKQPQGRGCKELEAKGGIPFAWWNAESKNNERKQQQDLLQGVCPSARDDVMQAGPQEHRNQQFSQMISYDLGR